MTIGERVDRECPQRCLICDQIISVRYDWPVCPACHFDQTSPEAYTIRRACGWLWRSGIELVSPDDSSTQNRKEKL